MTTEKSSLTLDELDVMADSLAIASDQLVFVMQVCDTCYRYDSPIMEAWDEIFPEFGNGSFARLGNALEKAFNKAGKALPRCSDGEVFERLDERLKRLKAAKVV